MTDIFPPINPFVSFKDYIDCEENRDFINDFIEKMTQNFVHFFREISAELVKKTF